MTEEETKTVSGVLIGLVCDSEGKPFIGLSTGGASVAITPFNALILFDQLASILESIGALDEDGEEPQQNEGPLCH